MTTKKVELWCDLWPGWQDSNPPSLFVNPTPNYEKHPETKRIKITVELPCFGGTADFDGSVMAKSEIVPEGLVNEAPTTGGKAWN